MNVTKPAKRGKWTLCLNLIEKIELNNEQNEIYLKTIKDLLAEVPPLLPPKKSLKLKIYDILRLKIGRNYGIS